MPAKFLGLTLHFRMSKRIFRALATFSSCVEEGIATGATSHLTDRKMKLPFKQVIKGPGALKLGTLDTTDLDY